MCRLLGVSRSGFYAYKKRKPSRRAVADAALVVQIKAVHDKSVQTYGYRRVQRVLIQLGEHVNHKRIQRLMRVNELQGRTPKLKRGIRSVQALGVHAPDRVLRKWNVSAPNLIWVADFTYIRTWEGWAYLAVVMDAYSRRIVGWSLKSHMKTSLVQEALDMAVHRRKPPIGLVHHSDHGSQYTALTFGQTLRKYSIEPSMGRVRTCYDNAVAESFFATLKKELTNRFTWPTRHDLHQAVFEYIETWYNTQRLHSTLGYQSPAKYEQEQARHAS